MKSFHTYINLLLFIVLTLFGFYIHEPWRDELQIWLIVIKSNSLVELYINKDADHPFLLYFILYVGSFISKKIIVNQFIHLVISLGSVILILKDKKITPTYKTILIFGYYFLFEYNIIVRSYAITVFLLLLFLNNYKTNKINIKAIISLILIAFSNIMGLIIAFSILLFLTLKKQIKYNYFFFISSTMLISFIDVFYQTAFNWGHFDNLSKQTIIYNLEWYSDQISTIWRGFVPIPNFFEFHFWNTNIIDAIDINYLQNQFSYFSKLETWLYLKRTDQLELLKLWSYIILSSLILIGIIISFWKDKKILFLFFLAAIPMWILFAFIWHGSVRHHGHFFLLFLVCYWFLVQNGNQSKFSKVFLTSILILQIPGGIYAYYMDYKYEFSGSEKVANYINENFNKDSITIAGGYDYSLTPISYHLNKEFYNPQSDQFNSFINWSRPENVDFNKVSVKVDSIKPDVFICSKLYNELLLDFFKNADAQQLVVWKNYQIEKFESIALEKSEEYIIYSKGKRSMFDLRKIKSLKILNNENITYTVDTVIENSNYLIITGWAINHKSKSNLTPILKSKNKILKPFNLTLIRKDISKQYGGINPYGFKIIVNIENNKEQEYYLNFEESNSIYETDFKIKIN